MDCRCWPSWPPGGQPPLLAFSWVPGTRPGQTLPAVSARLPVMVTAAASESFAAEAWVPHPLSHGHSWSPCTAARQPIWFGCCAWLQDRAWVPGRLWSSPRQILGASHAPEPAAGSPVCSYLLQHTEASPRRTQLPVTVVHGPRACTMLLCLPYFFRHWGFPVSTFVTFSHSPCACCSTSKMLILLCPVCFVSTCHCLLFLNQIEEQNAHPSVPQWGTWNKPGVPIGVSNACSVFIPSGAMEIGLQGRALKLPRVS